MAQSKHTNEEFREAAARLYANVRVEPHGAVMRPQSGGAFVECYVWVEESDVEKPPTRVLTMDAGGRS